MKNELNKLNENKIPTRRELYAEIERLKSMKAIQLKESDFKKHDYTEQGMSVYTYAKKDLTIHIEITKYDDGICSKVDVGGVIKVYYATYGCTTLFENIKEIQGYIDTAYTALSAKQEPCEVCKEVKNLWGSPNIDINGYDYCPNCGRKLEEV